MKIENVRVYGLEESIVASGYPMSTETGDFDYEVENIKYWFQNDVKDIIKILKENPNYISHDDYVEIPFDLISIKLSYEDLPRFAQYKWYYNQSRGYVVMTKSPYTELHRFIAELPESYDVDHINRDKNDYRRENLRLCTRQNNTMNRDVISTNKSGFTGVYFAKSKNRWVARIEINKKAITLGSFKDKEDAIKRRLEAEREYFGEFAPQRHLFNQYGIANIDTSNISRPLKINPDIRKAIKHYKRFNSLGNSEIGSGHNCFLKGTIVQADITAPQYFWLQWERYHFQDTISSQSTMHRITQMDLKSQMNKYVLPIQISTLNKLIDAYNTYSKEDYARGIEIEYFPMYKIKVHSKQELFQYIISNTPEGIELTRRLTFNYLQLKSMYNQRGQHKIEEWREVFCPWILTLPHFKELCLKEK